MRSLNILTIKRNAFRSGVILTIFLVFAAWIDPFHDEVVKGNSRYNNKKYKEAGEHYERADEFAPDESGRKSLSFNRGNAEYMKGNYQGALDYYRNSLQSDDKDVQKKAFFNMGNSFMKMERNKEAVESFINALKVDPKYEKAKRNIEYLLSKKQQHKKKKQDKNNTDKDKNKKDQNKKKEDESSKNKKNDKEKKSGSVKSGKQKMNKEQIKSLLESMKKKPVRRKKGSFNEKEHLEKYW